MCNKEESIHSIKALVVFRENGDTDNLFVPILCDAIHSAGINVKCSLQEFWNTDIDYDIIHFQWPEEVVGWNCDDPGIISRMEERIAFFRSKGARFVYTRHNEHPHCANEIISRAYDIIEAQSDVIVHMGRYGLDEFAAAHPASRHVIIPHHIYEYTYNESFSIERARQFLKLPQDAFIIASFGEFRNREEINMVTGAFREWEEKKKLLLAPRLYPFSRKKMYGKNILKRWGSRFGYYVLIPLLNRWLRMRAGASDELVDNCDLAYYIAASDAIIIQQIDALNSENVPLAFLFHKIVLGPDEGNIGELLCETGNPVFNPYERSDILHALQKARQMAVWYKGEINYAYAKENMNIEKTGQEYARIYKELANS